MGIGAISGWGYMPYIYNTNTVSSASLDKVSAISNDVTKQKADFSGLAEKAENENPLKPGQTLNFQSMLDMQLQMGFMNADRLGLL